VEEAPIFPDRVLIGLTRVQSISSFLAGYDSGVAGGILTYKPFQKDFKYTAGGVSKVNSLTVGLEQLGSFVACFIIYPLTNKYGRKYAIIGSSAVFILGAVIQTINTASLGAWYTARFIAGLGMGGMSVVVPMYSAEMTPKEIRGRCGSFYQWMYTWGILTAYWVDYVSPISVRYSKLLANRDQRALLQTLASQKPPANGRYLSVFKSSLAVSFYLAPSRCRNRLGGCLPRTGAKRPGNQFPGSVVTAGKEQSPSLMRH
jgi:MFS family permease